MVQGKHGPHIVAVVFLSLIAILMVPGEIPSTFAESALPAAPGFYRVEAGQYIRHPDCRGDECKGCVPKDWVEAARMTPVTRRAPAFLLRSLIVPPQKGQGVPSIITLRVDAPNNERFIIHPVLKAVDSSGEALLLSFKEDLVPGIYTVRQDLPGAVSYARFESAQDSICFVAMDSDSKIMKPQVASLGVFVVSAAPLSAGDNMQQYTDATNKLSFSYPAAWKHMTPSEAKQVMGAVTSKHLTVVLYDPRDRTQNVNVQLLSPVAAQDLTEAAYREFLKGMDRQFADLPGFKKVSASVGRLADMASLQYVHEWTRPDGARLRQKQLRTGKAGREVALTFTARTAVYDEVDKTCFSLIVNTLKLD